MSVVGNPVPGVMTGVQLVGHGRVDQLHYRDDIAVPAISPGEVLIRVAAAAVNNTDINTRIGWYSKSVKGATEELAGQGATSDSEDASWSGAPLSFPRIQGSDCCGHIVAVGDGVDAGRVVSASSCEPRCEPMSASARTSPRGWARSVTGPSRSTLKPARGDLQGRLRVEPRGVGHGPLRLFHSREHAAPGASQPG